MPMSDTNNAVQDMIDSEEYDIEQFDLGPVSAYAIAVAHGFVGTEEEFIEWITDGAKNAAAAKESADNAAASEKNAGDSATDAATAAKAAADAASAASGSADTASTKAKNASDSATTAAKSESNAAASEKNAGDSATAATNAKNAAVTARDEAVDAHDEIFDVLNNATILDTTETVALNSNELVEKIVHTSNETKKVVRTDVFTYDGNVVTEVRTAADGRTQTNVYNLETLEQKYNV